MSSAPVMDLGCVTFISMTVNEVLNKFVLVSIYDE
jgi:hypothetical protein